jgi:hypothetical protein
MITNPGTMRRLKDVATIHPRRSKDSSNGVAATLMAVWALMTKNFPALFLHGNIGRGKTLGEDTAVDIAIGICEQDYFFTGGPPQCNLETNMFNENGAGTAEVGD